MTYVSSRPELVRASSLDANDVARILGCTRTSVQRRVRRGELPPPNQRQPFLRWEAADFWPLLNRYLTTPVPVPLAYWAAPTAALDSVTRETATSVQVEYPDAAGGGLVVVFPRSVTNYVPDRSMLHLDGVPPDVTCAFVTHLEQVDVSGTGFEVIVFPGGTDGESYVTTSAALARAVGGRLPYWVPGTPLGSTFVPERAQLVMNDSERGEYQALRTGANICVDADVRALFDYCAHRVAREGYLRALDLTTEAREYGNFDPQMRVQEVPERGLDTPDWARLARIEIGAGYAMPEAARAAARWNRLSQYGVRVKTLPVEALPTDVEAFVERLMPVDPQQATLGHLMLGSGATEGVEYLRDPLCPEVIATRYPHGEYTSLAILPARLSTFRTLPSVLSPEARITPHRDTNVFITTPDGVPHPLPCVDWSGYNYGYGGAGPRALAAMLTHLLHPGDVDDEEFVQRSEWLSGTILEDRACPDSFTVAEARYLFPARS